MTQTVGCVALWQRTNAGAFGGVPKRTHHTEVGAHGNAVLLHDFHERAYQTGHILQGRRQPAAG
jgi:hypothetical protein